MRRNADSGRVTCPQPIIHETVTVYHGDALEVLRGLADASVDAVVTDPPYGLGKAPDTTAMLTAWLSGGDYAASGPGFMGADWDAFVPGPRIWREVFRVLKPGGHAVVFAGARTVDLMGLALRLAGFEVRDTLLAWVYSSGMPKATSVATMLRKDPQRAAEAPNWDGWSTALKPAHEPILLVRKPLIGTVAANVVEHGTGALHIDATRVPFISAADEAESKNKNRHADFGTAQGVNKVFGDYSMVQAKNYDASGRWPSNVLLIHNPSCLPDGPCADGCPARSLEEQAPAALPASRFFPQLRHDDVAIGGRYIAKAPRTERPEVNGVSHPTVKPLALMEWLVRLTCPPGGTVLDPFAGSGTTAEACMREGMRCITIERDAEYLPLIAARITRAATTTSTGDSAQPTLFDVE